MADAAPGRSGRSLRFRLTALATVATAAVLVLAAVAIVWTQERQLTAALDESLERQADEVERLVGEAGGEPTILPAGIDDDTVSQVLAADGSVRAESRRLDLDVPLVAATPSPDDDLVRTVDSLPVDDASYRVLSRRFEVGGDVLTLHVAANLDDVTDSVRTLSVTLAVAIPVLVGLLAGLLWWLTGRALAPVEAIRAEVAGIGGSDLARRVPEPPRHDEIGRLARTMNAMLDRVEDASLRQQRFVADASHDLRGPLARMRTELEVDLAHPDSADRPATQESVLAEVVGLQRLVDDLLALARSDGGVTSAALEPVDLDDLALREARRIRADGRVQADTTGVDAAQVVGDPGQLTRLVRNLVDNATRHARTVVGFEVHQDDDGEAVLVVSDDGPGIPAADRERVFERFTRLDEARTTDQGGTGLGLAIVADIARRHGGSVTVEDASPSGARIVVRLPAVPPPNRAPTDAGIRRGR